MDYKAAEHEEAAFVEPVRAENGIVQASYVDLGEPSISGSFPCTQQVLIPSTSSRSNLVSCSSQVSVSSSTAGSPRSLVRVLTSGRASRPRSAGRTGQLARAGGAFAAKAATAALSNNASAPVGGTSSPSTWQRNDSSAKMSPGRSPHAVDTSSRPNSTRRNSSPHAPVRTGTGSIMQERAPRRTVLHHLEYLRGPNQLEVPSRLLSLQSICKAVRTRTLQFSLKCWRGLQLH